MYFLKIVNVLALLFIFTPFFQMCSDNSFRPETASDTEDIAIASEDRIMEDSLSIAMGLDTLASTVEEVAEEPSPFSKFWDLITAPGKNFTLTGFGMLVRTIFQLFAWTFITWVAEILISISILLSIYSLIRVLRNKSKKLSIIVTLNFSILITTFILAFITFEKLSQIKWGFYIYSILILIMVVQSFRLKKHTVS